MPVSIFVSRLGITHLVNTIKIDTDWIKLFHSEIYIILFLFKSFILICNNILEYHIILEYIFYSSKKEWCYACFPISKEYLKKTENAWIR